MHANPIMFATGIENSYPTVLQPDGRRKRIDELAKTGHYDRWRDDFGLVNELGIPYLRYGPPYYTTHTGPGQYNWGFADETFACLKELGITPIVDLCHFGVPDWVGDFQNGDWPHYFAEYAKAFAQRFPDLRLYTPINEIYVTAMFSAQYGWWNEALSDDRSFVRALHTLCKANVLAMRAIAKLVPDAVFIQSESSEYFHPENPDCIPLAELQNERRFLSLDLTYGHPVSATMYRYLLDNGLTAEQYDWFGHHQIRAQCIMGNDYYATNEHLMRIDGSTRASGEVYGYYVITKQYFDRYRLPVMHTETNRSEPNAVRWLHKEWANWCRLKRDGVPMVGFTWYSLLDQVDWDTALRDDAGRVNPLGLCDLNRTIRPVGVAYRELIRQWQPYFEERQYGLLIP